MNKKFILLCTLIISSLSLTTNAEDNNSSPKSLADILLPAAGNYEFCRLQYENCRNGIGAFVGLKETWKCQVAFDRCRTSGYFSLP